MFKWIQSLLLVVALGYAVPALAQDTSNGDTNGSSRSSRSSRSTRSERGQTTDDRERRRESRSQDRESNSRSSSRRSSRGSDDAEKQAADSKDKPAEGTKTVKTDKPKSSNGKSGASGAGGGRPTVDIKFEMQVDPETNIMYLEAAGERPSLNVNVLEDKKFVTRLALYNPRSSGFSQVDASLKYDPEVIRPVGVDSSGIQSNLTKPARVLVDKKRGLLSLALDFKEPRTDSFMTIVKIQWEALQPVANTEITFLNTDDHPSGVFSETGENILHQRTDGTVEVSSKAGLLDATVSIEAADGTIELAENSENPFSAVALATNINMGTAEGGIQLFLRPRKETVQVGETFLVDIMYRNPRRADMDTVKLKLRFDPEVLQVVDYDENNWITRGINIFDGAYHEELPFDHHRRNTAFNNIGLITYDHGFGSRTPVSAEGTIATIRFQATAPAVSTPIVFSTGEDGATEPDTAISFLGFNLIGKPGQRQAAMSNAAVSVR